MPSKTSTPTHRYVPQGPASLSSDAPGWSAEAGATPNNNDDAVASNINNVNGNDRERSNSSDTRGPICWKCKGTCRIRLRSHERIKKQKYHAKSQTEEDANVKVPPETKNARTMQDALANMPQRPCPVCNGDGFLPMRYRYIQSLASPSSSALGGSITARRRRPQSWEEFGHVPPAVRASNDFIKSNPTIFSGHKKTLIQYALSILSDANGSDEDYDTPRKDLSIALPTPSFMDEPNVLPSTVTWLPIHPGEQLCNLVGQWRILQRIGSHRWTTDDLVTAYVGASTFLARFAPSKMRGASIRYLDLGTGNASVLQMVTWYLLSRLNRCGDGGDTGLTLGDLKAVGVEARSEAVGFARRSLSFNLDSLEYDGRVYSGMVKHKSKAGVEHTEPMKCSVQIVQGDFRDLISLSKSECDQDPSSIESQELAEVSCQRYDLITGTPPYFRVDFSSPSSSEVKNLSNSSNNSREQIITAAIIQQGGMPTSMQSAPARCEFRGGVEAYCETASAMLTQDGIFAVCENWLNNDRVWMGAKNAGLEIDVVWPVLGKVGKKDPLFAVYVMRRQQTERNDLDSDVSDDGEKIQPPIAVRDLNGKWTSQYAEIMEAMSIPVL